MLTNIQHSLARERSLTSAKRSQLQAYHVDQEDETVTSVKYDAGRTKSTTRRSLESVQPLSLYPNCSVLDCYPNSPFLVSAKIVETFTTAPLRIGVLRDNIALKNRGLSKAASKGACTGASEGASEVLRKAVSKAVGEATTNI